MRKGIVAAIVIIIVLGLIGGLGYFAYRTFFGGSGTITVWTLPGNEAAVAKVAKVFHDQNPAYKVRIQSVPEQAYEFKSMFSLASEKGPDVWIVPNEWMEQHRNKLVAAPNGVLDTGIQGYKQERAKGAVAPAWPQSGRSNAQIIKEDFAPAVYNDVVADGAVWGVPLNMDSLALFYDRTKINVPPATWQDVAELTKRFTLRSGNTVTRSTVALGDSESVEHGVDLLSTIMMQNGADMVDAKTQVATFNISKTGAFPPGTQALDFYTSFMRPDRETYTWQKNFGNGLRALKDGKTMMAFGYLNDLIALGESGQNNIAVAPLPQANPKAPQTYGRYLAATVTKQTPHPEMAWKFISLFANPDLAQTYATDLQAVPARTDVAKRINLGAEYKTFIEQSSYATNWTKADVAEANKALSDAIRLVLQQNQTPQVALDVTVKGYTAFLQTASGIETDPLVLSLWQSSDDNTDYRDIVVSYVGDQDQIKRIAISRHRADRYEWEILNAMAARQGPDILLLPNDWIARFQPTLRSFLAESFNPSDGRISDLLALQRLYVPAVGTDNVVDGKIYGMPANIETLMIGYNVDAFNALRQEKNLADDTEYDKYDQLFTTGPAYWDDLKTMAQIATKRNGNDFSRAFIALGTGQNVAHAEDIFAVLVKQFGGQLTDPDRLVTGVHLPISSENSTVPGQQAEALIKSFAQPQSSNYTWNRQQPNSLEALADGKVMAAFMYPRDIRKILERNPQMKLRFFSLPQVNEKGNPVDYASYYSLTLPKSAKRPNDAFSFIKMAVSGRINQDFISPTKANTDVSILDRVGRGDIQKFQKDTAQSYYKGAFPEVVDQAILDMLDGKLSLDQAANKINVVLREVVQ